jgi:hypothetical protein
MTLTLLLVAVAVGLASLLLGHSGWHGWHIDHEVKPIEVVTLIINVAIVVILQQFLAARAGNIRAEKDLVIDNGKDLIQKLRESDEQFAKRSEKTKGTLDDWRIAVNQSRALSNALEHFRTSLALVNCKKCRSLDGDCEALKQQLLEYKRAITNDPPQAKIAPDSIRAQSQQFRSFLMGIQKMIFTINSH